MEYPVYCIIHNRPVKAVRTPEGDLAVLTYSLAKGDFELAMELLPRILFAGLETDFISEEEFEAHIERLREEANCRRRENEPR